MPTDEQVVVARKWAHDEGYTVVEIFVELGTSACPNRGCLLSTLENDMKIALYASPSIARGEPAGISTNDQVDVMEKWAHDEGHTIVGIFVELGASACIQKQQRPVFERMVSAATSPRKPFGLIVEHPQCRVLHRHADREILEQKLRQHGVELFIYGRPRLDDETLSFLERNITGMVDEFQRREAAMHTVACMKHNAEAGFYNGGLPPYGYRVVATDIPSSRGVRKVLAVDEEEAEVLRKIFRLVQFRKDGSVVGMKRIAEGLNAKGILRRGKKWTMRQVECVLANPVCIGTFTTFRRDSHTGLPHPMVESVTTKVPPILRQAEFEAVHRLLRTRMHSVASRT